MNETRPLVSIGMPAYNAAMHIRDAVDSLLDQDYRNFELIISDNASSDATFEICQDYARKDKRVKVYLNKSNFGAHYNFEKVLTLAQGKYFMWAGTDDVWKPHFISELLVLLEQYPTALTAMCRSEKIDLDGNVIKKGPSYESTNKMNRYERLLYSAQYTNGWIFYGLYRTYFIKKSSVFVHKRLTNGSPELLLLHRCMNSGDFMFSNEILFCKRQSSPRTGEESNKKLLFSSMRALFWHCYGVFFRCFDLKGFNTRERVSIYRAILKGLPQRSYYIIVKSILHQKFSTKRVFRGLH
jgi:glycosyltransferase involved in cell wall biosynthesis